MYALHEEDLSPDQAFGGECVDRFAYWRDLEPAARDGVRNVNGQRREGGG